MKFVKKFKWIFLQMLLTISLIGVGYSSWMVDEQYADLPFSGQVGDIFDLDTFFTYDSLDAFKVSPFGIVDDEQIVFKGDVIISLKVKIKEGVINFVTQKNKLDFAFYIKNNGTFDLFNATILGSNPMVYYTFDTQFYKYTFDNSMNAILSSNELFVNLSYINESMSDIDYLFCTLKYTFDFSSYSSNFEEQVFNKIDSSSFIFNFKAGLNING